MRISGGLVLFASTAPSCAGSKRSMFSLLFYFSFSSSSSSIVGGGVVAIVHPIHMAMKRISITAARTGMMTAHLVPPGPE